MAAAAYKMNLTALLDELDKNSLSVYREISVDPEIKTEVDRALGFTLPLWMAGASNDRAHRELLCRFDAVCNVGWFEMRGRQELQMKLLGAIGSGQPVRHKFMSAAPGRKLKPIIFEILRKVYQDIRIEEVVLWVRRNDQATFIELLKALGHQKDEVSALSKEYVKFKKEIV